MIDFLGRFLVVWLLLVMVPLTVTDVAAGEGKQMVFYPTDTKDAGEFGYLRNSVRLMLVSRLAQVAGLDAVMEENVVAKRDSSSYRIVSSLRKVNSGIEISAAVFSPGSDTSAQLQRVAAESAGLVAALDELVAEIGTTVFEVKSIKEIERKQVEEDVSGAGFTTPHPDRAIKANSGFALSISQDEFVAQAGLVVKATERYKSAVIPAQSKGMTAADIDGDSNDEIILCANTTLYIYQLRDKKILALDTISLPGGLNVHAVNAADLDGNGIMEVYISSTRNKEPRSYVLEWTPETGAKMLHENVYFYLRPLEIPGEGLVLAGQRNGVGGEMQPGIYRLSVDAEGRYRAGEAVIVPESVNLFDFVFADLNGDKIPETVTINRKEQLLVYTANSELIYTSPSGFGGRELLETYTAPIRLVVTDFDNDGYQDILIVDNELYSPKMMSKTRLYRNGQVRGLVWGEGGFVEMWHTNLFPCSIVDFQFYSKVGADGNLEGRLFIVEPEKGDIIEGFLFGSGGSRLSVYGMSFVVGASRAME